MIFLIMVDGALLDVSELSVAPAGVESKVQKIVDSCPL